MALWQKGTGREAKRDIYLCGVLCKKAEKETKNNEFQHQLFFTYPTLGYTLFTGNKNAWDGTELHIESDLAWIWLGLTMA